MQQGNFNFLDGDYQRFYEQVRKAETYLQTDAEACAIFCRKALEEMVAWMFDTDRKLESVLPDGPERGPRPRGPAQTGRGAPPSGTVP